MRYQVVTANSVRDGVPVYFTEAGEWSTRIGESFRSSDPAAALARAQADPLRVIAPYIIDVVVTDGVVRPVGLREEIRAYGPTA
jgi:hypothetical protein